MDRSDDIKEIATALAKAQSEIGAAAKNADNPYFNSKYADIAAILDVIRGPAAAHGLAYVLSAPETSDRRVVRMEDKDGEYDEYLCTVTTKMLLMHTSGQWLSSACSLTAKDTAQAVGSASTYGMRYCLRSMFAVATEDDDGNAAKSQGQPAKRREPPQPQRTSGQVVTTNPSKQETSMEEQLRASVNQASHLRELDRQQDDANLGIRVAEACKAIGWNKVQHTQLCMDTYGRPWAEMTVLERREQLAKLSAMAATGGA